MEQSIRNHFLNYPWPIQRGLFTIPHKPTQCKATVYRYLIQNWILLCLSNVFKKISRCNFLKDVNFYFKTLIMHFYLLNKGGTFILSSILPDCYKTAKEYLHITAVWKESLNILMTFSQTLPTNLTSKFIALLNYLIAPVVKTQQNVSFNTTYLHFYNPFHYTITSLSSYTLIVFFSISTNLKNISKFLTIFANCQFHNILLMMPGPYISCTTIFTLLKST